MRTLRLSRTADTFILLIGLKLLHLCGPEPDWRP